MQVIRSAFIARVLPFLPAVCIGLLAAQPFLAGQISQRGDALLHVQRLAQLDALIRQGILYSRWQPDLALGFGYPLFNYYAPLAYYLAGVPVGLGVPQTAGLALTYVGLSVLAAIGCFGWLRDMYGPQAGLIAAAGYTLAPYVLSNAIGRGALAEQFALSVFPVLLWALYRLATGKPYGWVASVITLTALLLGHNISVVLLLPISLVLALAWGYLAGALPRLLLRLFIVVALALGASAFFWLPALVERDLVYIERTIEPVWANVQNNFLPLSAVLAWPSKTDPRLIVIAFQNGLSPIIIIALLMGVMARALSGALRPMRLTVGTLNFMVLALVGGLCVWLCTATSAWLWQWLPLLRYVQFPSRLLGPASLMLAACCGAGLARVAVQRQWIVPLLMGLLGISAFSQQVLAAPLPAHTSYSPAQMAAFERRTSLLGSTSGQEYTPRTVLQTPGYEQSRWQFDGDWLDRTMLPDAVKVDIVDQSPLSPHFRVVDSGVDTGPAAGFTATLRIFAFPGWQAYIDGRPAAWMASQPFGWLSLAIPAGNHDVQFRFGNTPLRNVAEGISCGALVVMALSALWRWHLLRRQKEIPRSIAPSAIPNRASVVLCVGLMALLGLKHGVIDHINSPFIGSRFDGSRVESLRWPAQVVFGDQLVWMGADGTARAVAGKALMLQLFWRVRQPVDGEFSTSVQLVDSGGRTVAQSDHFVAANLATFYWEPNQYAIDEHIIALPVDLPTGRYQARIVVYPRGQPLQQLPMQQDGGAQVPEISIEVIAP